MSKVRTVSEAGILENYLSPHKENVPVRASPARKKHNNSKTPTKVLNSKPNNSNHSHINNCGSSNQQEPHSSISTSGRSHRPCRNAFIKLSLSPSVSSVHGASKVEDEEEKENVIIPSIGAVSSLSRNAAVLRQGGVVRLKSPPSYEESIREIRTRSNSRTSNHQNNSRTTTQNNSGNHSLRNAPCSSSSSYNYLGNRGVTISNRILNISNSTNTDTTSYNNNRSSHRSTNSISNNNNRDTINTERVGSIVGRRVDTGGEGVLLGSAATPSHRVFSDITGRRSGSSSNTNSNNSNRSANGADDSCTNAAKSHKPRKPLRWSGKLDESCFSAPDPTKPPPSFHAPHCPLTCIGVCHCHQLNYLHDNPLRGGLPRRHHGNHDNHLLGNLHYDNYHHSNHHHDNPLLDQSSHLSSDILQPSIHTTFLQSMPPPSSLHLPIDAFTGFICSNDCPFSPLLQCCPCYQIAALAATAAASNRSSLDTLVVQQCKKQLHNLSRQHSLQQQQQQHMQQQHLSSNLHQHHFFQQHSYHNRTANRTMTGTNNSGRSMNNRSSGHPHDSNTQNSNTHNNNNNNMPPSLGRILRRHLSMPIVFNHSDFSFESRGFISNNENPLFSEIQSSFFSTSSPPQHPSTPSPTPSSHHLHPDDLLLLHDPIIDLPSQTSDNYTALLGLARQLASTKGRGLSKEQINSMKAYQYKPGHDRSDHDQTNCVVCMGDFEARQKIRVLSCQHHFHSKCIDRWLKTNNSCPICRMECSAEAGKRGSIKSL